MNSIFRLILEMIFIGIAIVLVSLSISILQEENPFKAPHLYRMVEGIFLTGAITHFIFEVSGLNAWYVRNYRPLI